MRMRTWMRLFASVCRPVRRARIDGACKRFIAGQWRDVCDLFCLRLVRIRFVLPLAVGATACGIAVAPAPIAHPDYTIPTAAEGKVAVKVKPAPAVGDVIPVYVAVTNGDATARELFPRQVYALTLQGVRVAPIPLGEAARMAGGADELAGSLESGLIGASAGGALGAGLGALVGAGTKHVPENTLYGGAIGTGIGAFESAPAGQAEAQRQAGEQLSALTLPQARLNKGFSASGYVFFPKGNYTSVELLLVNTENAETERYEVPWGP